MLRYDGTTGAFLDVFASGGGLDEPTGLLFVPEPAKALLAAVGALVLAGAAEAKPWRARGTRGFRKAAFDEARSFECQYLLRAEVTHWEDRLTWMSNRPDKATLSVEVYEVAFRDMVASQETRGV